MNKLNDLKEIACEAERLLDGRSPLDLFLYRLHRYGLGSKQLLAERYFVEMAGVKIEAPNPEAICVSKSPQEKDYALEVWRNGRWTVKGPWEDDIFRLVVGLLEEALSRKGAQSEAHKVKIGDYRAGWSSK